jgi:O-methyltransferase
MLQFSKAILDAPSHVPGCVVEAGCFKGGSTAKFSIAAKLANRQLFVFDSFEGLPANSEPHKPTIFGVQPDFYQGRYRGALEEVQGNVLTYGDGDVCVYVKGWFDQTMPQFSQPVIAVYLDVDLVSSTKTCLKYLYPLLQPGSYLFSQDAHLPLIIELLEDSDFWENEIGFPKPTIAGLGQKKLISLRKPLS